MVICALDDRLMDRSASGEALSNDTESIANHRWTGLPFEIGDVHGLFCRTGMSHFQPLRPEERLGKEVFDDMNQGERTMSSLAASS
jgi:hypothetical protein